MAAIGAAEQAQAAGQWRRARELAAPHVRVKGLELRARGVLANCAMQLGEHAEAVAQFRWLQQALPGHPGVRAALSMALNNLGSTALQAGDPAQAESHYREAVVVDARNALAWFNLGSCAQAGNRFDAAAQAYAHAATLDPRRLDARLQWALCERVRGEAGAARSALAGLPDTLPPELAAQAGAEWELLGEAQAAQRACAQAIAGGDAALVLRIAGAQAGSGAADEARASARISANRSRDDGLRLRADLLGALVLPMVPSDEAEIAHARAAFADGVVRLARDWPGERLAASGARLDDLAHSHYALAYQGGDDLALACAFGDWYASAAAALARLPGQQADPHRRRLALVSARWHLGTIAAYFGPWIGALRSAGWRVELFHLGSIVDPVTHALAAQADAFHHLPGALDDALQRLRECAPQAILYPEIGLSPRLYPLAALHLAPHQAIAWGHPVTSGLPGIDEFWSCSGMEPPDAQAHYRERLRLLPGLGTCYPRPPRASRRGRAELGLPEAGRLYLVPHAPVKIAPALDVLMARIAAADGQAHFVLFEDGAPALGARLRARLRQAFGEHGLDADRHLHCLPRASPERFREVLAAGDVLLDTPGFSGGNTSLDALAQCLPLVALPGTTMRSRQSATMLRLCEVPELVADSPDRYVEIALEVAADRDCAARLRARIDSGAAQLFDDAAALQALGAGFAAG